MEKGESLFSLRYQLTQMYFFLIMWCANIMSSRRG